MIKTIQIAAVILAVFAIAALVGAAYLGIKPDPARRDVLGLTSVVEEFRKTTAALPSQTKTSPLVAQAQLFTKRIDPPPAPRPVERGASGAATPAATGKTPPPSPPASFEVVATAVNPLDATKSYALLSQPGKGYFWVKPNDEVSRAVIKQVLPGRIVTADGREYSVARVQRLNLLKPGSPPPPGYENYNLRPSSSGQTGAVPVTETASPVSAGDQIPPPPGASAVAVPQPSTDELKANVEWLKAAMENPESIGLTKEEAAQLGNLGEILKDMSAAAAQSETQAPDANAAPAAGSEGGH